MVKLPFFLVKKAITLKECNPEIRFLPSAGCCMVLNIYVKFHGNILNDFEVTDRTRVCGKNCHFSMFKQQ